MQHRTLSPLSRLTGCSTEHSLIHYGGTLQCYIKMLHYDATSELGVFGYGNPGTALELGQYSDE